MVKAHFEQGFDYIEILVAWLRDISVELDACGLGDLIPRMVNVSNPPGLRRLSGTQL
jgi:hypothetical protein